MVEHNVTASLAATAYYPAILYGDHQDWPNNKIAYESDGTLCIFTQWSTYTGSGSRTVPRFRPQSEWRTLNSLEPVLLGNSDDAWDEYTYYFIFPEPRTITHYFAATEDGYGVTFYFYASTDTTTGWDGTWTQIGSIYCGGWWYYQYNREHKPVPVSITVPNAVAVKAQVVSTLGLWGDGGQEHKVHIYGDKSLDGDRLALWHPTRDEELEQKYLDWGTYPFGTNTLQFRVKNLSPTKRALDARIFFDDDGDTWGSRYSDMHSFTYDGVTGTSVSLPTLQSKAVSGLITVTRTTPMSQSNARWFSLRINSTVTWRIYIHNPTVTLSADTTITTSRNLSRFTTASLVASPSITDGTLYRNSGDYRAIRSYIGSRTNQAHAGSASLVAMTASDLYLDEYRNEYGNDGLHVTSHNPFIKATAALNATVYGDNYYDNYTDGYGNSSLSATP